MTSALRATSRRTGITVAAAVLLIVGMFAGTASAFSYWTSGSPGNVTNKSTMGGFDLNVWDEGRTVQESPAYRYRDQKVCITTRLWRVVFAGAGTTDSPFWQLDRQHRRCGTIAASQTYIPDNGVAFPNLTPGKFYSVDVVVRWYLLSGVQIGYMRMDWNAARDYTCYSSVYRCSTGNVSWGTRDAFITFN